MLSHLTAKYSRMKGSLLDIGSVIRYEDFYGQVE
jgi:hypothetical protein